MQEYSTEAPATLHHIGSSQQPRIHDLLAYDPLPVKYRCDPLIERPF